MHDAHSAYEELGFGIIPGCIIDISNKNKPCYIVQGKLRHPIIPWDLNKAGLNAIKEAGGKVKSKMIRKLMRYKPGNYSRDFFRNMKLPLVPWTYIRVSSAYG